MMWQLQPFITRYARMRPPGDLWTHRTFMGITQPAAAAGVGRLPLLKVG